MKIAILPGDGIGPEIVAEAVRVLEVLRRGGLAIESDTAPIGGAGYDAAKVPLPEAIRPWAAKSLQLGYGMTSGVLYSALRVRRGSPVLDGALLGIGVWAAGYLGWLPATDLMSPITEHEPKQIVVPLVQHALFGVAVAAAYDGLMRV